MVKILRPCPIRSGSGMSQKSELISRRPAASACDERLPPFVPKHQARRHCQARSQGGSEGANEPPFFSDQKKNRWCPRLGAACSGAIVGLRTHGPETNLESVAVYSTAWDSEIESLTSRNPSLIELDRRKTRRRHRVTAVLAPRKSCFPARELCVAEAWFTTAFFLRMIEISGSSARRDHSCDR